MTGGRHVKGNKSLFDEFSQIEDEEKEVETKKQKQEEEQRYLLAVLHAFVVRSPFFGRSVNIRSFEVQLTNALQKERGGRKGEKETSC